MMNTTTTPLSSSASDDKAAIDAAGEKAHRALDAAATAWYEYAALLDVGPDRTRAFNVYENIRQARRL
jgi:hypothetical protein